MNILPKKPAIGKPANIGIKSGKMKSDFNWLFTVHLYQMRSRIILQINNNFLHKIFPLGLNDVSSKRSE